MDELFQIIGKLYTDMYHAQKFLENLQEQLKTKDGEILALKSKMMNISKDNMEK
jgi:hypothetical protein